MGVKHHDLGTRMVEDHPENRYRLSNRLNWPVPAWNPAANIGVSGGIGRRLMVESLYAVAWEAPPQSRADDLPPVVSRTIL